MIARFSVGQRVTIEYEIVAVGGVGTTWYDLQMVNDHSEYLSLEERRLLDIADDIPASSVSTPAPQESRESDANPGYNDDDRHVGGGR